MGTHWIKRPGKSPGKLGQSWQIVSREGKNAKPPDGDKTPKTASLKLPALVELNVAWHAGKLPYEEAEKNCKVILKQLRAAKNRLQVFHSENQGILEAYWEAEYSQRILIDKPGMKRSLISAINHAGHLSLRVVTRNELQVLINDKFGSEPKKHRRVCSRINQILDYLQRDFRLVLAKEDSPEVRYISEVQLGFLLNALEPEFRPLIATLFYTGMRLGEVFCFKIKSEGVIRVEKQVTRDYEEKDGKNIYKVRPVKNRKPRTVAVPLEGWHQVMECHRLMQAEQYPRGRDYLSMVKKAAKGLWKNVQHHIVLHDLRHSYAIHMLNKGCSLTEIALMLGDGVQVAQQFYVGFVAKDETIDLIRTKLQAS